MGDISILKMVVAVIGLVLVLTVIGIIYLVVNDKAIPGTLETLAVASVTGLLGLLAPSRAATQ